MRLPLIEPIPSLLPAYKVDGVHAGDPDVPHRNALSLPHKVREQRFLLYMEQLCLSNPTWQEDS